MTEQTKEQEQKEPMTAKEYLYRYRNATREAESIELKITQIRLKYGSAGAIGYSNMPKAHNNSDLSDYIVQLERLEDLLVKKYTKCLGICVDIEERLDRMKDQDERDVIRHRYTVITDKGRLNPWENVADAMHYSKRQVQSIHGNALQHFPVD